jgi:alpha-glucosidase (family GH31 glycosyl hydrolase)
MSNGGSNAAAVVEALSKDEGPAGTEWTDAWTGKKLAGGQVVKAEAPIEHIPVYIRGDKPALLKLFTGLYE